MHGNRNGMAFVQSSRGAHMGTPRSLARSLALDCLYAAKLACGRIAPELRRNRVQILLIRHIYPDEE